MFASDALAEQLEVPAGRRISLCILIGIIAWPVAAIWGHAEDALAMTFAIYAMVAMLQKGWSKCGWLLGVAIVMQPLVALTIPLFIGAAPQGRRFALALRSAALSAILVGVAFIGNPSNTYQALVKQPTPPAVNHATPWVSLAPTITSGVKVTGHSVHSVIRSGRSMFTEVTTSSHTSAVVAGGPGRLLDVLVAVLLGLYVWRRPQNPTRLLWLVAVVLASRCFFEPVMTPYYLAPPLFLALIMAARQHGKRFWPASVIAVELTVFAYHFLSPWAWWSPLVVGLTAVLALGYPRGLGPHEAGSSISSHP